MKNITCTRVQFTAFGQYHTLYTNSHSALEVIDAVAKICPTAHVTELTSKTKVTQEDFSRNNLESLLEWNQKIKLFTDAV